MNREWREVTLGEISIDNKGNYGIGASAVEYSKDLYTYLRISDITDGGILNMGDLKSVDDENAEKYLLKPNDIVFARTGNSTGRSYFYDGKDGKFVYAGFLIKFSLNDRKVNPKYVRYYTLSNQYKNWVNSFKTGSTRGNINAKTYGSMKIKLPPREQQDFLVNILSTLDDKIETNKQINKKLEEMAQTIFKHWFVDFEFPNEGGEPYKSSGGEMVDSELGMIPKGWEVVELGEFIKFIKGKRPKLIHEIPFESSKKYLTIDVLNRNSILYGSTGKMIIAEPLDILMVMDGASSGTVYYGQYGLVGSTLARLDITNRDISNSLIFHTLKYFEDDIKSNPTGSAIPHADKAYINKLKLNVPLNSRLVDKFEKISKQIRERIITNNEESQNLTQLRDTLLPKLMSGEIRIPLKEGDIS